MRQVQFPDTQADGTQLAVLSIQVQELISLVEARAEVVGRDLEEINCLKIKEKDAKETEKLKGFIVGAGHEAQVFKDCLNRMEENLCRCGQTPSEVGDEFVSSEEEGRMELSYASVREDKYVTPPMENSIPIPVPAPCHPCGLSTVLPALEEISKEPAFICEDLGGLLREADEGRARDLQEGSSQSVLHSPPRLGSERWRRLNGIHWMRPGPGRRAQRATRSCPYLRRDSTRHLGELWGSGEPGRHSSSPPSSSLEAINTSLLRGDEGVPPSSSGRSGLVFQGEELVWMPGGQYGLWICNPPEDQLV